MFLWPKRLENVQMEARERRGESYEGWNFNSGNYLFTTATK